MTPDHDAEPDHFTRRRQNDATVSGCTSLARREWSFIVERMAYRASSQTYLVFLWLTVPIWTCSFLLQFALLAMPFAQYAHRNGGILTRPGSASNGVHTVSFSGAPGDAVMVLVTKTGDYSVAFPATRDYSHGSTTTMAWDNAYSALFQVGLFALISLPILSRLLRRAPNKCASPNGGPAAQTGSSGVTGGPPSVS